jgi:hypothetical protein
MRTDEPVRKCSQNWKVNNVLKAKKRWFIISEYERQGQNGNTSPLTVSSVPQSPGILVPPNCKAERPGGKDAKGACFIVSRICSEQIHNSWMREFDESFLY